MKTSMKYSKYRFLEILSYLDLHRLNIHEEQTTLFVIVNNFSMTLETLF